MARPIRDTPKPQSTMPVATLARPSVIRTGASSEADGSVDIIRSTSDDAKIPVMAAVELSGPAIANGNELPSAIVAARTAEAIKGAATPVGTHGARRAAEMVNA